MDSPVPTGSNQTIGGMKIPKPLANTYQAAASNVASTIRTQTASRGHNVFRPDVYRVSEGYLN